MKCPQKNNKIQLIPRCLHCGLNPIPPALRVMRTNARGIRRPDACVCKTCANVMSYEKRWEKKGIVKIKLEIVKISWKLAILKKLLRKNALKNPGRQAEDTIDSGVRKE